MDAMIANAALGWLELGMPAEALAELEQLSPEGRRHPAVLQLRWEITSALPDWEMALGVAREQIQTLPTEHSGYLNQAYALRRVRGGGVEKARNALLPAARLFPDNELVAYNLACYTALLGQLEEAAQWLLKALKVSKDAAALTRVALHDDDLRALWPQIKHWRHTHE